MSDSGRVEPVEAVCPKCQATKIFYLGREQMPQCELCKLEMVIKEVLREGKRD